MTSEASRLHKVSNTIRASIHSARTILDVAEGILSRPFDDIDWVELAEVLYKAQSALMVPASLAREEANCE